MSGSSHLRVLKQAVNVSAWGFAIGFLLEANSHKLPMVARQVTSTFESVEQHKSPLTSTTVRLTGIPVKGTAHVTVYDGSAGLRRS